MSLVLRRIVVVLLVAGLSCGRYGREQPDGQSARRAWRLWLLDGQLPRQPRLRPGRSGRVPGGDLQGSTRPGDPPGAGAGSGSRARGVVPRRAEVGVLRRFPGDQPGGGSPFRIQQPQRDTAVVGLPPGVRSRRGEVLAGGDRGGPLVLLLLDLRDLVRVLVAARVPRPRVLGAGPQYPGAPPPVAGALAGLEEPRVAGAGGLIVPGRAVHQAVGVDRRLPVAEVGAVPAPADPPSHPGLLDRLAYKHAVLLELFREYSVQERIAAGVQWQHEHGEHLRLLQGH